MIKDNYHESVMVKEVIEALHIENQARYIDATVGTGGHTVEIGKKGGIVLGIDMDESMLEVAEKRLKEVYPERSRGTCPTPFKLVRGNFKDIDRIAKDAGFSQVSGVLFDLGVSNIHLTDPTRGFSFGDPNATLDMRLDTKSQGVTAADLVNALREDQLRDLFSVTLDRGSAGWLARRITQTRSFSPIKTVGDFLDVCRDLRAKPSLNPATLPFLALRIAVNSELENLKEALPKAYELLVAGGKLVVISFHSGEDAIVKDFVKTKPIYPTDEEIRRNPRARSAKMRVLEKL